jgi:L-histidine Nalpha-methyltransferase / hercynylcysteine S-oxide synthase
MSTVEIIDIRSSRESLQSLLRSGVHEGLSKDSGSRTLPSELLYDEVGLRIYNESLEVWSRWYYPIPAEKEIVQTYGADIASELVRASDGRAVIIELGAG